MRRPLALVLVGAVLPVLMTVPAHASEPESPGSSSQRISACAPIVVYGVRGTDENHPNNFRAGFGNTIGPFTDALTNLFPKGTVDRIASTYPASFNYWESVNQGVNLMVQDLDDLHARCPRTQIVPAGFSQGADVIRRAMPQLARTSGVDQSDGVANIVLFGDPNWKPDEKFHKSSDPTHNYKVQESGDFSLTANGLLRTLPLPPFVTPPPDFTGDPDIILSYCHGNDVICQTGTSASQHLTYGKEDATPAAWEIARSFSGNLPHLYETPAAFINSLSSSAPGEVEGNITLAVSESDFEANPPVTFTILAGNKIESRTVVTPPADAAEIDEILAQGLPSGPVVIQVRAKGQLLASHLVNVT